MRDVGQKVMRHIRPMILAAILWSFSTLVASAQQVSPSRACVRASSAIDTLDTNRSYRNRAEVKIYFRNNRHNIERNYRDNSKALQRMQTISHNPMVRNIEVVGAASPIGTDKYNQELSLRRANNVKRLLRRMNDTVPIAVRGVGEDWKSFTEAVEKRYRRANREEVLRILRSKRSNTRKERQLKAIDPKDHYTWDFLVRRFMPQSRYCVSIFCTLPDTLGALIVTPQMPDIKLGFPQFDKAAPTHKKTIKALGQEQPKSEVESRKMVAALRTNLLVPALNFGLEIPIKNNWSIGADYYYPWIWPSKRNRNCFEMLSWSLEARYWFGRNRHHSQRLQGHSIGLYGGIGYYDFEHNYNGHQGEFVNVGVDYTYAMPVGRKKNLHFEFSIGVGFIHSRARIYTVYGDYNPLIRQRGEKRINYFGPTKANISLVVPLFKRLKHKGDE